MIGSAIVASALLGTGGVRAQGSGSSSDPAIDSLRANLNNVEQIEYPDVRSIGQDSTGFIWMGINHPIRGGLIRFDGYETKHYTHDIDDETSLSHNQVSFVYFDRDDVLWVGTIRGGLNRYNPETDDFTRFLHDPRDDTSLPSDDIEDMLQASDGTYWVATETGLARFDPATATAVSFSHDPDNPNSLPSNRVRTIAEDSATGELWLGTGGGLSILDPETLKFRNYAADESSPTSLSDDSIESILRTSDGVWWLGTSGGLDRYNPGTDDFTPMFASSDADGGSESSRPPAVAALLEDAQGRIWVGHSAGLQLFDRELGALTEFVDEPTRDAVLGESMVQALFQDDVGAIWIGTRTEGAARVSAIPRSVAYHRHDPDEASSIGSDFVARLDASPNGLWVLTDSGVEFFDGTRFVDYTAKFGLSGGWPDVSGILAVSDEIVWLGFDDGRLARADATSGDVDYYDVPAPADDEGIWPVAQSANGDVWYRIPWGFGVGVLRANGQSELLIGDEVDPDGPEQAYAYNTAHFFDPDEQVLWVTGLGLTRIDVTTGSVDVYSLNTDNPKAVVNQLWSVDRGPDGHLWVASRNGVHEFDPNSGSYRRRIDDILPVAGATDARFGPDGRLWIVSGPILTGLDIASGDMIGHSAADEAAAADRLPLENWVSSKFEVGADRKMYAPTLEQGLVSFSPFDLTENPDPPTVVVTEFALFGQSVEAGGEILDVPVHLADQITLQPQHNTFSVEFSALSYEHPERNQYRYRLDGFDRDWQTAGADRRVAAYTNVPPGDYTFRVQASNDAGVWTPEGIAVSITVLTPWYQTWWAKGIVAVALIAVLVAVFRWRTSRQRARNRELQDRLAERIRYQQERELLLAEVQAQSERLESILAAAPTGVVLLGADGAVLLKNKVAAREFAAMSEFTDAGCLARFAGLSVTDLMGDDGSGTWTTTTVDQSGSKRSLSVTVRPIDRRPDESREDAGDPAGVDGSDPGRHPVDAQWSIAESPVDGSSVAKSPIDESSITADSARGWVLLWDDITELEALQQRRAREDRLAAVGRFAAGIAHDVNNVLNVIGLNAELVNLDPDVSPRSREHLVHISRETGNASKFITQILDFSRQSVSEREALNAYSVVATQVDQLRDLLDPGIELEFTGHDPSTIWADPVQLERIVLNLVRNAQDAIGSSGKISVVVDHVAHSLVGSIGDTAADPGDSPGVWVRLAVSDDGSGIDAEVLPTIFEPFVTTKPVGKGTGLGLAQVAGISAEHGGRVAVETEADLGTTVSVLFPAADLSEFEVGLLVAEPANSPPGRKLALVLEGEQFTFLAPARPGC